MITSINNRVRSLKEKVEQRRYIVHIGRKFSNLFFKNITYLTVSA